MLSEDQRALGVFERKVLRTIFGKAQYADGAWRRRIQLYALLGELTITHMVKIERLRWAGHVMIEDDLRIVSRMIGWRITVQSRVELRKLIATARATPALALWSRTTIYQEKNICE